ncbi:hypothetical protein BOM_1485 (plasmid) [Borrelia miyamotoi FR64b]|uniref:Uncharacterized protein n=1 Tax=Borrelia miyamotoi FR64b TaxID=1292392 RepID=W5SH96_9SPIR|nr:hypothetical protein BOM_1485 [Borrelia miyamotoi FR64b]
MKFSAEKLWIIVFVILYIKNSLLTRFEVEVIFYL